MYFSRFRGISDVESLYLIWEEYKNSDSDMKKWCSENYIDYEYMKNVKNSIEKSEKVLKLKDGGINDDIMKNLYLDRKLLLDLNRTILSQYYDNKGFPYKPDVLSINKVEEKRFLEVYGIITSKTEDVYSIVLSYVSPESEKQEFVKGDVTY